MGRGRSGERRDFFLYYSEESKVNAMKHRNILLVEDDPDDELLTLRALHKSNVLNDIIVARDGAEALEYLFGTGKYAGRDATDSPAMVLLDLRLPKIGGMEVLEHIRADVRTRLTPVVILTSSQDSRDVVSGYDLTANSYIRKPVDFQQFAKAVHQIGLYWLVLNEPIPEGILGNQEGSQPV